MNQIEAKQRRAELRETLRSVYQYAGDMAATMDLLEQMGIEVKLYSHPSWVEHKPWTAELSFLATSKKPGVAGVRFERTAVSAALALCQAVRFYLEVFDAGEIDHEDRPEPFTMRPMDFLTPDQRELLEKNGQAIAKALAVINEQETTDHE